MDTSVMIEMIGYVGSALVLVSMLMTSVVKLRVINLIGSVIFAAYAVIIRSWPTAIMNICLAGINVWHLTKLLTTKKEYTLVSLAPGDAYLAYLLGRYGEDIRRWQPESLALGEKADTRLLVCDGDRPAGLFLAKDLRDGAREVLMDYTLPAYRDSSVGKYLYRQLAAEGARTLVFRQDAPNHVPYLVKTGYTKQGDQGYELKLRP